MKRKEKCTSYRKTLSSHSRLLEPSARSDQKKKGRGDPTDLTVAAKNTNRRFGRRRRLAESESTAKKEEREERAHVRCDSPLLQFDL